MRPLSSEDRARLAALHPPALARLEAAEAAHEANRRGTALALSRVARAEDLARLAHEQAQASAAALDAARHAAGVELHVAAVRPRAARLRRFAGEEG
jgi:hypothetical protein